ncbi:glutathione peroxidase [Sungkyunkwania multivorans]|uniref:Glutathione peroxidase n=1 Tax=Sungkyunkwania multivorans TaxID=1173618 RepID=A0ABW3CYB4_9FLAO
MKTLDSAKVASNVTANNETTSIFDISINDLGGNSINLSDYKGRKMLFVNVASECGFTKQYKDLQELSDRYPDDLVVIGSPCNQFGKQEPGDAMQIKTFCEKNFGVTFLLTEKINVKGKDQHPLYQWLSSKKLNGKKSSSVKWNFQKYLVDENGKLIDHYLSFTNPLSAKITKHL